MKFKGIFSDCSEAVTLSLFLVGSLYNKIAHLKKEILFDSSKHYSLRQLAKHFNCAPNTIRNELKRGAHPHIGRSGATRGQRAYITSHSNSICRSKRKEDGQLYLRRYYVYS